MSSGSDLLPDEVKEGSALKGLMRSFDELTQRKADLESQLEGINSTMRTIEPILLEELAGLGMQNFSINGRTYYRQTDLVVSRAGGATTQGVIEALRAIGLGDLVTEEPSYNPASLKARVREMLANGESLDSLRGVLYIDEPIRLRSRKS